MQNDLFLNQSVTFERLKTIPTFLFLLQLFSFQAQEFYTVNPKQLDFGTIYCDTILDEHYQLKSELKEIWLKNTGAEPFIINRVNWPGEICVPNYPKDPIKAGDSALITLQCNSFGCERSLRKTFIIETSLGQISIKMTGEFKYMPHFLEISKREIQVFDNKTKNEHPFFTLKNVSQHRLVLTDFRSSNKDILIREKKRVLKPGESVTIYPDFSNITNQSHLASFLYFNSDGGGFDQKITLIIWH